MLNVVCVNAGNYQSRGVEYVNNLYRGVSKFLTVPHRFVCFSDDYNPDRMFKDSGYLDGIYLDALPNPDFKGWWSKIGLFKPGLFEECDRVLYFDLSAVIVAPIDDLAAYDGYLCMTPPFGAVGPFGGLQSSVMAWGAGYGAEIYSAFIKNEMPLEYIDKLGGDQAFIQANSVAPIGTWKTVRSYKWHCENGPGGASVVVCHGHPKPHETGGWLYRAWSGEDREEIEFIAPAKFVNICNTTGGAILENIRANITAGPLLPRVRIDNNEAVVVGGGPSVHNFWEEIEAKQKDGAHVFALNGAGSWLGRLGIDADYLVLLDARRENIEFLDGVSCDTTALLATQCHPDLVDLARNRFDTVVLFHVNAGDESVDLAKELEPGAHLIHVGTTVGLTAMNLVGAMGYRKIDLYGFDSSNAGEGIHHAYPQPLNDTAKTQDFVFEGQTYRAARAMASQAEQFIQSYQRWEAAGLKIKVHGEGLLPDMWRHEEEVRSRSTASLEASEAYKYRRCWQNEQYREYSPGETLVDTMIEALQPEAGARFIDFGCGSGRATAKLIDMGFSAIGVDHASNSIDRDLLIPFCIANLWALPENIEPADHGFCCDVLEHIPGEKVDAVLANIARLTKKSAFFNIDSNEAIFGRIIGAGELHVTVKPPEWWRAKLREHFEAVHQNDGEIGWFVAIPFKR